MIGHFRTLATVSVLLARDANLISVDAAVTRTVNICLRSKSGSL